MVRLHALKTRHKEKIKLLLFSILLALLLSLTADVVLKAARLVKPSVFTLIFILEFVQVTIHDLHKRCNGIGGTTGK